MNINKIRSYADSLVRCVVKEEDEILSPFDYPQGNIKQFNNLLIDMDSFSKKLLKPLIEKEQWGRKYSDSYIERSLRQILLRAFNESKKGRSKRVFVLFTELVTEFENFNAEQVIYLPLSNIDLFDDDLKLGPITLLKITEERYNELTLQAENIFAKPEQSPEMRQARIELFLGSLKNSICAKYTCVAYDERAVERAQEECERVLDLLRFTIHMMGQDRFRVTIGLKNEVSRYMQTILVFSKDGQQFRINNTSVGPLTHFQIGPREIQQMKKFGIFDLADCLELDFESNSFYEALFRSLRWFARGQMPFTKENQFLNLTTCLEMFFSTRNTPKLADSVATGVAYIVTEEPIKREQLKKRMKDLYNLRSRISHGGHSAMSDADLEDLRNIAGKFLTQLIQRKDEFQTGTELQKWVAAQNDSLIPIKHPRVSRIYKIIISLFKKLSRRTKARS